MTPFEKVYEMVICNIQDYRMNKILQLDEDVYYQILKTYLIRGSTYFTRCKQSLEYDDTQNCFINDLTNQEIVILADYTIIQWFKYQINNILAFNNKLQNKEFKTYSESQNLKEKKDYLIFMEEKVSQDVSDYITTGNSWIDNFKL